MSSWFVRDCGHKSINDPCGNSQDEKLSGICIECKNMRIGEKIKFIRFGDLPVGASRNFRDGNAEEGISVYELDKNDQPILTGWHFGISARNKKIIGIGEIVGWGSDG